MRGAGGTRERAEPALGDSRFAAAAAACPWGCVLGPGGWRGAPFCPWHCPPRAAGTRDALGCVPGAWYRLEESGGEEEEDEAEEERVGSGQPWDISSEDSDPHPGFCWPGGPFPCPEPPSARRPPGALWVKLRELPLPWGHPLTAEEAERNARELVAEEERMKRRAEKKRLKKKKQKDRKKQAKLEQELRDKAGAEPRPSSPSGPAGGGHTQDSPDEEGGARAAPGSPSSAAPPGGDQGAGAEETEDELDLSCSFVRAAQHRAGVRPPPAAEGPAPGPAPGDTARQGGGGKETPKPSPPTPQPREPLAASVVEQSLVLAGRGNEAAQRGHYAEAVLAFTEAVKLNPWEHRLFGNRSYCYEKLRRYEEALRDAEVALGLQPGWLKGFFRKGKALRGLQRYAEAASTFEELLRRDGASADARAQLETCRALLRQHGPRARSGPGGVPVSPSLLEAEEPPLPREQASGSCRNTSGFVTVQSTRSQARGQGQPVASSQQPLPPTHPARDCYPLWVGNVTPGITEKVLRSSFGRFGEIRFVRALPQRRCAFINYARKKAAEAAYAAMQDAELEGSRLVLQLKHPSHATPSPQRGAHPRGLR